MKEEKLNPLALITSTFTWDIVGAIQLWCAKVIVIIFIGIKINFLSIVLKYYDCTQFVAFEIL